ncbi:PTS sugar transporter subunit IIB [Allobaculum mucilyticum]|uniref:PTS sugar transporter subunit IIB n=1 Tax=Allobaculum mucilyticum TaxID=2834459 RepID=UPI001E488504|nr:hypothetical protein [Allobaculum mucilyticum]UNT96996.1 PTS sugar transporter subunit IIB [Allobaculum mucilyticum]
MRIDLICSGGLTSSWIVEKLENYIRANKLDIEVNARGLNDYYPLSRHADAVLLGPQIGYYKDEVEKKLKKPVAVISSRDYALANSKEIIQQANLLAQKKSVFFS